MPPRRPYWSAFRSRANVKQASCQEAILTPLAIEHTAAGSAGNRRHAEFADIEQTKWLAHRSDEHRVR